MPEKSVTFCRTIKQPLLHIDFFFRKQTLFLYVRRFFSPTARLRLIKASCGKHDFVNIWVQMYFKRNVPKHLPPVNFIDKHGRRCHMLIHMIDIVKNEFMSMSSNRGKCMNCSFYPRKCRCCAGKLIQVQAGPGSSSAIIQWINWSKRQGNHDQCLSSWIENQSRNNIAFFE